MPIATPVRSVRRAANSSSSARSTTTVTPACSVMPACAPDKRDGLHRAGHEKSLTLLSGGREHELPIERSGRRRENLFAAHDRTRVERDAFAVAREERRQRVERRAAQQPAATPAVRQGCVAAINRSSVLWRMPSRAEDTASSTRVSPSASAKRRSEPMLNTDIAPTASATIKPVAIASRPASPGTYSRVERCSEARLGACSLPLRCSAGDALPVELCQALEHDHARRRRAPNASTTVLTINVNSASSINNDATANAPTRSYSS